MKATTESLLCYHCGEHCKDEQIQADQHHFCCEGCKTVYSLLKENNLCDYYQLEENGGNKLAKPVAPDQYAWLDSDEAQNILLSFKQAETAKILFFIPGMHCSSCIWLLEKLYRFLPGIHSTRVNFDRKELMVSYNPTLISLRQIVEKLAALGYEPALNHNSQKKENHNRMLLYRLGVAGFAMGNIMLFSFPEYLGMDSQTHLDFSSLFRWLSFALALPVLLFSAQPFWLSAFKGLKAKTLNIDFPLAIGIFTLFTRSALDVIAGSGPGFFDSLSALVFFLLVGRWMQDKAYEALSFERDYKSYFPVAVEVIKPEGNHFTALESLKVGDHIKIRNHELIPADARIISGLGSIDYSFVTGESEKVQLNPGEMVYAGGRQTNMALELEILKPVSQSYLTSLWNKKVMKEDKLKIKRFSDAVGQYFTWALVILAVGTLIYWLPIDEVKAFKAFTAVLIVACPCVLVIAAPFALGNAMRFLGKKGIYLKNPEVVESVAAINTIAFDKTGTLTKASAEVAMQDYNLLPHHVTIITSIFAQSAHPLARIIAHHLKKKCKVSSAHQLSSFEEFKGKGIFAVVDNKTYKLGSAEFTGCAAQQKNTNGSEVWVTENDNPLARFTVNHHFREGLHSLFQNPKMPPIRYLFSGDNPLQKTILSQWFKADHLFFNCSPQQKLAQIESLQQNGHQVMMIGDGLNDSGALKAATVGVAITDDINTFTPASEVIMVGKSLEVLPAFIQFCKKTMLVIKSSFLFSLIYNSIWMYIAVQGNLEPLIAALLMPISSITVFTINTLGVGYFAKNGGIR